MTTVGNTAKSHDFTSRLSGAVTLALLGLVGKNGAILERGGHGGGQSLGRRRARELAADPRWRTAGREPADLAYRITGRSHLGVRVWTRAVSPRGRGADG